MLLGFGETEKPSHLISSLHWTISDLPTIGVLYIQLYSSYIITTCIYCDITSFLDTESLNPSYCTKCVQPSSSPVLKHVFPYKDLHGWITKGLNIWNPQKIIVKSDKTTLTSGQIYGQHLGIYWGYGLFLFIGYIPHMVVNISSDLRPDLLVVWSQEAEMSQAPPRREPGRAASAPGLKKFRNRRLMAIDICHGDCISLIIYIEEV